MKEQNIRKPMYAKEEMGRLVKWVFGLPLIFVIWLGLSLVMPAFADSQRMLIVLNIISYLMFIMVTIIVVSRFLKFPFKKMLCETQAFRAKFLFAGFVPMFCVGIGTTLLWKVIQPQNFTYTLQPGWPIDFALAFVLVTLAAFLEEVLCRAYIAYFVNDNMENRPKKQALYILASALVFTIAHFQNPEVSGSQAIYSMVFYFIMGAALMAVTLRTKGIEAALGIHMANNLINAWFFTYKDAALITNAVYTHANNIGPWMLVQSVLCVVLSMAAVLFVSKKRA